jgi:hypothetical protein
MLDPEKTPKLLAALKAAVPFEVEMTEQLIKQLRAQHHAGADQKHHTVNVCSSSSPPCAAIPLRTPREASADEHHAYPQTLLQSSRACEPSHAGGHAGRLRPPRAAGDRAPPRVPAGAELGAGAELPGRPQPPGLRKKSCSAPTSSRAPQIPPANPTPRTGTERRDRAARGPAQGRRAPGAPGTHWT